MYVYGVLKCTNMLQCTFFWRHIAGLFQLWVQLFLQLFGFLLRAHLDPFGTRQRATYSLIHDLYRIGARLFCTVESHQNDLFLPSVPNDYTFFLPSKCFFKNCWDGILITLTSDRQPPDFDSVRTNSLGKPSSETVRRTCALEVEGPQISTGPLQCSRSLPV